MYKKRKNMHGAYLAKIEKTIKILQAINLCSRLGIGKTRSCRKYFEEENPYISPKILFEKYELYSNQNMIGGIKEKKNYAFFFQNYVCIYLFSNIKFIAYTFSCIIRGQEKKIDSYMRTIFMEYSQRSCNHEEEVIGLHVNIGNVEANSNGRRDKQDPVTIRNM
jgi:hypothetical protein